jgi:aspartyl-tRNA(Asn)/glutamyl-tRNA(Gln) amidotransferase subunit C
MSATIDRLEVRRIASLAHLRLSDEEQDRFARQLQDILAYVEQVQALDTHDVPPTFHMPGSAPADRADAVRPSLLRADALRNAPEASADGSLFKVPRVIG